MRIRPYMESRDYKHLEKWIDSEKIHAFWCANLISYPVTRERLHVFLEKNAADWMDSAYVATEDDGTVIGFFCYSVNVTDNSGFLKFIIVDNSIRGRGYGKKILQLALRYAFCITGVESVRLNVFEENTAAKMCYEKLGFLVTDISKNAFPYKNEVWSRCHMVITQDGFFTA